MVTAVPAEAEPADGEELDREGIARAARAKLAKRWLSKFVQQAVAAGVVNGCRRLEWGPHLEAVCLHTQLQIEGWIVANGPPRDSPDWDAWAADRARMIERQREAWEREWPVEVKEGETPRTERATWEDGEPEPWLRYVLVQNQIFNLAPGTFKSSVVEVCACAWVWLHAPTFSFGAASGVDANVTRDSNATRDIIRSSWYRETFGISWDTYDIEDPDPEVRRDIALRPDVDSVSHWATSAGGVRYSRTWQRGFTGLHVDGLFGDDPDDADRVHSESTRLATQNKWTNAMETRVNDEHRSIRLVMQQVVHVEGMSAYLLSIARWSPKNPKGWAQLCIPAEYGYGPTDAPEVTPYGWRDWRSAKGETMHPRLSPGVLADKRLKLPGYEGQYNQNASRVVDGIFERRLARWFVFEGENIAALRRRPDGCVPRADLPPIVIKPGELQQLTLSVDAANSLDPKPGAKVSAVGLLVGGCRGEERFAVDDRTRVLGVDGTYRAIYELIAAWRIERVLVELKALGAGVCAEIERSIKRGWYLDDANDKVELLWPDGTRPRCEVEPWKPPPNEDKVQRAHGALPAWRDGFTYLRDGASWIYPQVEIESRKTMDEGFIGEICSFPGSRRKDRVDAWSQFVARYRQDQDPRDRMRAMQRLALVGQRR